jgi:hypothetical protein
VAQCADKSVFRSVGEDDAFLSNPGNIKMFHSSKCDRRRLSRSGPRKEMPPADTYTGTSYRNAWVCLPAGKLRSWRPSVSMPANRINRC